MTRFKVKFAMTDDRTGVTDEDIGDQSLDDRDSKVNQTNNELLQNYFSSSISHLAPVVQPGNDSMMNTSAKTSTITGFDMKVSSSSFPSALSTCPSSSSSTPPQKTLSLSPPSNVLIVDNFCNTNSTSSVVVRRKKLQFSFQTQSSGGGSKAIVISTHVGNMSTDALSSASNSSIFSISPLQTNDNLTHHRQSGRDCPVMESCQSRTLIIDTDNDNKGDQKVKNSSPCTSPTTSTTATTTNATNYNTISSSFCCSSNSNYYASITSCTATTEHLTTTNKSETSTSIITFLTTVIMMMVATTATLTSWRSLHNRQNSRRSCRYHYSNHYRPRLSNNCMQSSVGGTFISSVIVFMLTANCTRMMTLVHGQPPPLPPAGFLDFDNLPVTRFSCEGKVIGGYYADVETGCQMFHVCTLGQKDEIQDIKFLCLNGTVFDQETRVCERVDEVECSKAETFFDLNLDLYVPHATTQKTEEADLEEEDDIIRPVQSKPKSPSSTTTTRATTTTTTPTPSPRTRPPTQPSSPRSRTAPVISSSSSQRPSSSQQVEDEAEDEEDDDGNGNNAYTSFNYYLKTPHSHVQSGYNSQSRQSYIFNQPAGPSRSSSNGGSNSGSSSSSSSSSSGSTGRKVPSGPGPKTIVYTSSSVSSSSTARPKTVLVVKATLPPSRSILKPRTLAAPRTTTTSTTPIPPPKYELDDQYDEYYDDEDYTVEQQAPPPSSSKGSTAYAQYPPPASKPALISSTGSSGRDSYDFRDARSSKGIANAGQTIISTGGSGKSSSGSKVSVAISSTGNSKPSSSAVAGIKVISSEFIGNNSTEEPYYYEDDYPDDITLQQQEQLRHSSGYSGSTPSSSGNKGSVSSSSPSSSAESTRTRGSSESGSYSKSKTASSGGQPAVKESTSAGESDYYDEDTGVSVNPHDHHFTHVDVPRIPYAKPNVPRVLVTNGKPFLPRLRRQSHHHLYYSGGHSAQSQKQSANNPFLIPATSPSRPVQNSYKGRSLTLNQQTASEELRQEARAKAREWGKDR